MSLARMCGATVLWAALMQPAGAQITLDGTLGRSGAVSGPIFSIGSNLGQQLGGNLFHSFSQFNLLSGEVATFSGPGSVSNIISRVTGGSASSINGVLQSTISGANLFLINPRGVMFGPSASINVSGSFHVSTANYLTLGTSGRFDASNPAASVLSVASPSAFGFLGPTPAPIAINGNDLSVPAGKTLSVVGGNIGLSDVALTAPGGRINLAATGSAGEITLGAAGIDVSPGQLGNITVANSSVHVGSVAGLAGEIYIRGGRLAMVNSIIAGFNQAAGSGGRIDVNLSGALTMDGGFMATGAFGSGDAGNINLQVGTLSMVNGAALGSSTFGPGRSGNTTVTASESILVSGGDSSGNPSVIFSGAEASAIGNAGGIVLRARDITLTDGGNVNSTTSGISRAGDIVIDASGGRLRIAGSGPNGLPSGVFAGTTPGSTGSAGTITVFADMISLANGGEISGATFGPGRGADIVITVKDALEISGTGPIGQTGIFASTRSTGNAGSILVNADTIRISDGIVTADASSSGAAGNVTVSAREISLTDGGTINSNSFGSGHGGNVFVTATEKLSASGDVAGSAVRASGIFAQTGAAAGGGDAGSVSVQAGAIVLRDGGFISSATTGSGRGGNINVTVNGRLSIGEFDATGEASGISALTARAFGGDAGSVSVRAGAIEIGQGGQISASTVGAGNAGNVSVAAGSIELSKGALIESSTLGTGRGGSILVSGNSITLRDGGHISAFSSATGQAGGITINAVDSLKLLGGSSITTESRFADGGDIRIIARELLYLRDSQITTSVGTGQGNGGNIFIDPTFVVLDNGQIIANAFGGNGGNISIVSEFFLASSESLVQASSALGLQGTVTVTAPNVNLGAGLVALPGSFFDAASQMRASCSARAARGSNSFTGAARGGLPAGPEYFGFGAYADGALALAGGEGMAATTVQLACLQ